jgi:hypothetical protein
MIGVEEDIEVGLDRDEAGRDRVRGEVDREAVIEIGRRGGTVRGVLRTGKTESWTRVMGQTANDRRGSRLRSSGGERRRRRELNTKVSSEGWVEALAGAFMRAFEESLSPPNSTFPCFSVSFQKLPKNTLEACG